MEVPVKVQWFKTTNGKIGIVAGVITFITIGVVLLVKHLKKTEKVEKLTIHEEKIEEPPIVLELPNGGVDCGPIKTDFDRASNYVKCGDAWHIISKDKVKIPEWKSLADNKTATDLLNNKYPN